MPVSRITRYPTLYAAELKQALADLESATKWIYETFRSKPEDASFGCCDYQRAFALTYLGYNWLRMAQAANAQGDEVFKAGKLATAKFFATKLLPQVGGLCATVKDGAGDFMALPVASL